jgi:hypothetical protein
MKILKLIAAISETTALALTLYWYDWKPALIIFLVSLSQNLSTTYKISENYERR